ncbi:MAG: hypothetical protein D8M59_07010 [Planctomycetes bacterium]|nr:hypothetical protein [Planctomycetota bacterium]
MPDGAVSVRLLQGLQRRIGSRKMGLWFEHTAKVGVSHDQVRVVVPSRFHADWITKNFKEHVCQAANDATGKSLRFAVEVQPDSFAAASTNRAQPGAELPHRDGNGRRTTHPDRASRDRTSDTQADSAAPSRLVLKTDAIGHATRQNDTPTMRRRRPTGFDLNDFVVGLSNRMAYEATSRFIDSDPLGPSLFVHGGCGLGKTHLLQGACSAFLQKHPGARVRYYTGEEFTNRYIGAIRSNTLNDFRRSCRSLDLLALDDVHFLSNKKATQNEFLCTFDEIGRCQARVLLASDEHPRDIMEFHERIVTRFLSGMVVEIHQPDRDMRLTLINRLSGRYGLALTPGAAELLATEELASVREIQGTLASLRALAEFSPDSQGGRVASSHIEVGVILVQKLLNAAVPAVNRPVQVSTIVATVADRFRMNVDRIMGSSRQRQAVLARSLCSYLARTMTQHSLPEIARALGRKNHTTVLAAVRRIEKDLAAGAEVAVCPDVPAMTLECLVASLKSEIRSAAGSRPAGRPTGRRRAV